MKKLLNGLLIFTLLIALPVFNVNAQHKAVHLESDFKLSRPVMLAGEKNHLNMHFKVTGPQTSMENFEAKITVPSLLKIDTERLALSLPDDMSLSVEDNIVMLHTQSVKAGRYYDIPLVFMADNGLIVNDQQFTFTMAVSADEFETETLTQTLKVNASSPLKINKEYMGVYDEKLNGSVGISPTMQGQWLTKASIAKSEYGQMFIKEGTKIVIEETFTDLLDYQFVEKGKQPNKVEANKLTWYFDAPSYNAQKEDDDFLFNQEMNVIYKIKDVQLDSVVLNQGSEVKMSFINIADQTMIDTDQGFTKIYPSSQATPEVDGNWWVPGHFGPADAFGNHSVDFDAMNTRPTVYEWASLQYAQQLTSYNYGQEIVYEDYEANYYINKHLKLEELKTPGEFSYRPNHEYGDATPLREQPILDLYVYDDMDNELAYFSSVKQSQIITRSEILSQKNMSDTTKIAKVKYKFVKSVPGMIIEEPRAIGKDGLPLIPTYTFSILPTWKEDAIEGMYALKNEIDMKVVFPLAGELKTEIYDFKSGSENKDYTIIHADGTSTTMGVGFHPLSAPRWANVIEDENAFVPTVKNTIALDKHYDSLVYSGKNKLKLSVINTDVAIGGVYPNIESYFMIPKNIELDLNELKSNVDNANVTLIDANYKGDTQLYKITWHNKFIAPGQSIELEIAATVSEDKSEFKLYHFTDFINHEHFEVLKVENPTLQDSFKDTLNQDLLTMSQSDVLLKSANAYKMIDDYALVIEKLVKTENETAYRYTTEMKLDEKIDYKLVIKNNNKEPITKFALIDILPHIGDVGITDFVARGSQFNVSLAQAITMDDRFTVYYSENENVSRDVLNKQVNLDKFKLIEGDTVDANWQEALEVKDFKKIKSFLIILNENETIDVSDTFEIEFKAEISEKEKLASFDEKLSTLWAHNSFALTVNGKPIIEPHQVSVKTQVGKNPVPPTVPNEPPTPETPVVPPVPQTPVTPPAPHIPPTVTTPGVPSKPELPQTGKSSWITQLSVGLMALGLVLILKKEHE